MLKIPYYLHTKGFDDLVFLYSSEGYGQKVILAYDLEIKYYPESHKDLKEFLLNNEQERVFTLIDYEFFSKEGSKSDSKDLKLYEARDLIKDIENRRVECQKAVLMIFKNVIELNRESGEVNVIKGGFDIKEDELEDTDVELEELDIDDVKSNMSDDEFKSKVEEIRQFIEAGDVFQVNLTRYFYSEIKKSNFNRINAYDVFYRLANRAKSAYMAYINIDSIAICSSSPERYIEINKKNSSDEIESDKRELFQAITSPIKGTMPRSSDEVIDKKNEEFLQNDPKNLAENLMITDLCRNDLGQICKKVWVEDMFKVTKYPNVFHLSSDVLGCLDSYKDVLDLILSAFPPASMTGASKPEVMKKIYNLEGVKRGYYSGVLGYISKEKSDLSVIIRAIITDGRYLEFQAGCGITYDSSLEEELNEMYDKIKIIENVLSIPIKKNS